MRDAMVAAINLNLFNKNSDRVKMANIAQTVNVLQAVILTEGEKMLLTPTWHVFKLFRDHQENTLLDSVLECDKIPTIKGNLAQITESVSEDENGHTHITLANLSATDAVTMEVELLGREVQKAAGEMLTNTIYAYNTFDEPDKVKTQKVEAIKVSKDKLEVVLPSCCVMHLEVE